MDNYKIEVMMTPDHSHGAFCPPYFWCVLRYAHERWVNCGHGWAATPEEAWREAQDWYEGVR